MQLWLWTNCCFISLILHPSASMPSLPRPVISSRWLGTIVPSRLFLYVVREKVTVIERAKIRGDTYCNIWTCTLYVKLFLNMGCDNGSERSYHNLWGVRLKVPVTVKEMCSLHCSVLCYIMLRYVLQHICYFILYHIIWYIIYSFWHSFASTW